MLFLRYKDNSKLPIANASKTLTDTQKRYLQIQKEALSIIFALKKYHQFLYGRPFILVTDHKSLISMFGPNTATPMLVANRLAIWSVMLSQYDYTIEYRSTKQHMATQMPSADYQLVLTCRLMEKKATMMSTPCAQSESSNLSCSPTLETS